MQFFEVKNNLNSSKFALFDDAPYKKYNTNNSSCTSAEERINPYKLYRNNAIDLEKRSSQQISIKCYETQNIVNKT